jgi:glycine cleavage system H protein
VSKVPNDRRYLETHEWHLLDGKIVTIGLTQYAADELTDITYVDLPEVGAAVEAESSFGEVESVKATAELNCGVTGRVTAVNSRLAEEPELVNNDPYEDGWMIKVEVAGAKDYNNLLSAAEYSKLLEE